LNHGRPRFGRVSHSAVLFAAVLLSTSCSMKPSVENVAAAVDGRKIYRADVEKYFQNQTAGSNQPLSDEQATSLRLSILRELIENEILMHRAEKLGLLATDEEVDRKLSEIKSPYSAEEFQIAPRFHLSHILVTTTADPQGRDRGGNKAHNESEARKKIETVLTRLEAGEDFSGLAMTYSEDSATAANGGDVGIVPESALKQTDAATRDSVVRLKPGQYTPVIALANPAGKQAAGFQIVKLLAEEPAGQRDLSDPRVEQEIRSQLQDRREQLLKAAYYEVLRNQAKVENYYAQHVLDSNAQ